MAIQHPFGISSPTSWNPYGRNIDNITRHIYLFMHDIYLFILFLNKWCYKKNNIYILLYNVRMMLILLGETRWNKERDFFFLIYNNSQYHCSIPLLFLFISIFRLKYAGWIQGYVVMWVIHQIRVSWIKTAIRGN
jgi:hypothetical protein